MKIPHQLVITSANAVLSNLEKQIEDEVGCCGRCVLNRFFKRNYENNRIRKLSLKFMRCLDALVSPQTLKIIKWL